MTKLFVFEFICGGGLSHGPLDTGLTREGGAMLAAAVEDAVAAGLEVTTTLDRRVKMELPGTRVTLIETGESLQPVFDRLAGEAGTALVIAPEFDGLLTGYARRLEALGVRSLGCTPAAIDLCGDKLATAQHLLKHGVPTPPTWLGLHLPGPSAVVAKPRWGAGCEDTFILRPLRAPGTLPDRVDWITQEFAAGTAASAAFLAHGEKVTPLRAGEQRVEGDGKLAYRGGRIPLRADAARRAMELGRRAVESVRGLHGYVGVDLVLGEHELDDRVIEINPRMTVSYVGARRLCATNLVRAMMNPREPITWRGEATTVEYDSAGMARERTG
ncbi:MAG: ATP-grasp domain-containing protein [Planctomycetes bacterium]|nr:ATP-grasp domain-containing protein [Planctomycetota bacterium]